MYNERFFNEIVNIMVNYIQLQLTPDKYSKITHIIIPYNSNILLGFGVAKELKVKAVKILKTIPTYHLNKRYEGIVTHDDYNPEHMIIVHDVLYTGNQIIESCNILCEELNIQKRNQFEFSFFALCARKNENKEQYGVHILKERGFDVHTIFEFDDQYINDVRKI
jgi:hypothetical protein